MPSELTRYPLTTVSPRQRLRAVPSPGQAGRPWLTTRDPCSGAHEGGPTRVGPASSTTVPRTSKTKVSTSSALIMRPSCHRRSPRALPVLARPLTGLQPSAGSPGASITVAAGSTVVAALAVTGRCPGGRLAAGRGVAGRRVRHRGHREPGLGSGRLDRHRAEKRRRRNRRHAAVDHDCAGPGGLLRHHDAEAARAIYDLLPGAAINIVAALFGRSTAGVVGRRR
jgi:hypothetical protein